MGQVWEFLDLFTQIHKSELMHLYINAITHTSAYVLVILLQHNSLLMVELVVNTVEL